GRVLGARKRFHEAVDRVERARAHHAEAMVRTTVAATKVNATEAAAPPPRWRPMTRRAWADRRRQQRAALATAQVAERAAAAAVRDDELGRAAAEWERLEQERRMLFPCPSDQAEATE